MTERKQNKIPGNTGSGNRRSSKMRQMKRRIRVLQISIILLMLIIAALSGILIYQLFGRRAAGSGTAGAGTASAALSSQTETIQADPIQADPSQGDAAQADAAQADAVPQDLSASNDTDDTSSQQTGAADVSAPAAPETEASGIVQDSSALQQAAFLAAGYDYDGAIDLLKGIPGYESDSTVMSAISDYEAQRDACVPVDVNQVPHIFYHSLVNEPDIAFNASILGQFAADGMNAWMTTVDEFDKITQQLYDNGYVYVRLRDLVVETVNADGSVSFTPNTHLMLPQGKKAIVLSIDDLSYYHSYESASFPDKLVLDENGRVKCHYIKPDGTESVGDYDVVPRLDTFLEAHPDGAYHGARGLIALTGYNGVFGYRTDIDYEVRENLVSDQAAWLEKHPEFNRDEDIAQAKVIADALKAGGWEFASHTWGHLSVTSHSVDTLREDNEKWIRNVQNIVGPTDTIIFAHGNDIGDWMGYSSDNEKYAYYSSAGYHFFCNVDGSQPYWVQITNDYVRQGRIDLDGYMLYQASTGQTTTVDHLIRASEVFDSRRPTPVVANGES